MFHYNINISILSSHDIVLFKKRTKRLIDFVFKNMFVLFYSRAMMCDIGIEKQ